MLDFRAFLAKDEARVLPYFGGTRVDAEDRQFRLASEAPELAPGWWRFQIAGRRASPIETAAPVELAALPVLRGHYVAGWVVGNGRDLGRIALAPDDEPPALARVVARRWYSGEWLFDATDFDDSAEDAARRALEERRPLRDVRGVSPGLRAAFGYALGMAVAGELGLGTSVPELARHVVAIADDGPDFVRVMFDAILAARRAEAEMARQRALAAEEARRFAAITGGARVVARSSDPRRRADEALAAARARMVECRRLAAGAQLEVTYIVDGVRVISTIDAGTFQVIDPGVCLAGAHRVLALDAMPSVIREAVEDGALNITRR